MVHHVLLSGVRHAPPGTAVGRCPGRRLDVVALVPNTSLHTPYHTWWLLPRRAWSIVSSPRCWSSANARLGHNGDGNVAATLGACSHLWQRRHPWHGMAATDAERLCGALQVSPGETQETRRLVTACGPPRHAPRRPMAPSIPRPRLQAC
jgi:hypothetical protein